MDYSVKNTDRTIWSATITLHSKQLGIGGKHKQALPIDIPPPSQWAKLQRFIERAAWDTSSHGSAHKAELERGQWHTSSQTLTCAAAPRSATWKKCPVPSHAAASCGHVRVAVNDKHDACATVLFNEMCAG